MNTQFLPFFLSNALSPALQGGIFTVLLYAFCFLGVLTCKLIKRGLDYPASTNSTTAVSEKKTPPQEKTSSNDNITEKKAPDVNNRERIYYLVERKSRKKPKNHYHSPKEIHFE